MSEEHEEEVGEHATVNIAAGQSIQNAINANPGNTTFRLASGMWREQRIVAKTGNQFVGDPNATFLSGARHLTAWTKSGNTWRSAALPDQQIDTTGEKLPNRPLAGHQNDLYYDNRRLERVATANAVSAGKWFFDPGPKVAIIADDPSGHLLEYAITDNLTWDNGATGVTFQNIVVEKYCTKSQQGVIHGNKGWNIQRCVFRQMHGTAIVIGENTVIGACQILDNGQLGIGGWAAHNAKVDGCEIAHNCWAGYNADWEGGGVKILGSHRVQIINNNCHDNLGHGLWGDIDCRDYLFANNTVRNIELVGIHYEISYGNTTIKDNDVADCGRTCIYVSNASGVTVTGNKVRAKAGNKQINGGISMINDGRGSGNQGIYQSNDLVVTGNTITHGNDDAQNGTWFYQNMQGQTKIQWDNNTYIVTDNNKKHWHFGDHNANMSFQEAQAAGYEKNGRVQTGGGDSGGGTPPPGGSTLPPGTYTATGTVTIIVS